MPLLGAHMSIEGGLHRAFERIIHVDGQSLQIFSKNQRQWRAPELTPFEIEKFIKAREHWGKGPAPWFPRGLRHQKRTAAINCKY